MRKIRQRTCHVISSPEVDTSGARTKRLVAQILSTEERERQRLASSLHDGPLQELACARLALSNRVRSGTASVHDAQEALTRAIAQLRNVVFDLYPPALGALGLEAAVGDFVNAVIRRSGLQINLDVSGKIDGAHDRLVFSVLREWLSNVERHAQATEVAIVVARSKAQLTLEVRDDGIGMSPGRLEPARREGHIGLASSAERVAAMGGTVEIDTSTSKGTSIRATLPARRAGDRSRGRHTPPESIPDRFPETEERRAVAV